MDKGLNSFITYLRTQLTNHSIYVWGAQGQDHTVLTEAWIRAHETSGNNADRAISFWKKQVKNGYGNVLRAFDCSGLGMYFIQNLAGISKHDMSSNSMLGQCERLSRSQMMRGDWVFRTYTSGSDKGKAYHIGYVVDDALNVIEDRGRDYGVVQSHIDYFPSYWNTFGRPRYFAEEIESGEHMPNAPDMGVKWSANRVMKFTKPYMKGTDIANLQKALIAKGYSVGSSGADGVFGEKSEACVKKFQAACKLTVDGKAGEDTVTALGGSWHGYNYDFAHYSGEG